MKRTLAFSLGFLLCLTLVLGIVPIPGQAMETTATQTPLESYNIGHQDYTDWTNTVESYLFENLTTGYTRLEYDSVTQKVYIEVYDDQFAFVSGKYTDPELPIFGGAYKNSKYYFLVFGQKNPDKDNGCEVIRVVKYNLKWQRLGSASVYGANTTVPFDAGAVRFAEKNGYLFIHTAHEIYSSHQANMTLSVKISDMTLTECCSGTGTYGGYASHSFNQFILIPGDKVVTLDHGDAYPRTLRLYKYNGVAGTDKLSKSGGTYVDVFEMPGAIGDNETGVPVGGFQYSDSSYLVAGTTVDQTIDYTSHSQRNIFITATARSNFTKAGTELRYLTHYSNDADVTVTNPHLVKLSDNRFLIMWNEDLWSKTEQKLCYAFLDGKGNLTSDLFTANAPLSDCDPIVSGDKVIWYAENFCEPVFFVLDTVKKTVTHQHNYHYYWKNTPTCTDAGLAYGVCQLCKEQTDLIPAPAYQDDPDAYIWHPQDKGNYICSPYGFIEWKELPVSHVYIKNPNPQHDYVVVFHNPATCTEEGHTQYKCSRCGSYTAETHEPTGHNFVIGVTKPTCYWEGKTTHRCTLCDYTYYTDIKPKTEHNHVITASVAPTCEKDGTNTHTCMNCGDCYNETVPKLEHNYTTVTVEATCYQEGSVTHTCTRCGDSSSESIALQPHVCDSYKIVEHPTDWAVGIAIGECTVCQGTASVSLPPMKMANYRYVIHQEATCEEEGVAAYEYDVPSGGVVSIGDIILPTGHSFSEGICTACGRTDPDCITVNPDNQGKEPPAATGSTGSTVPTLTLKYPSLSFEDTIIMNIYYTAENLQDVQEMGLITYTEKPAAPNVETANSVIPGYQTEGGLYYASSQGIAPKDIGDTLYFAVYAKLTDGSYTYTPVAGYSPRTYAINQLSTGSAEMKALVVAMLNYGAAAQTYFGYKTDALMNGDLTAAQKGLAASYDAGMVATVTQTSGAKLGQFINDKQYTRRYPTVSFEGAFCINYYFQPTQNVVGDVTMYIWSPEDYNAAEVLTKENATKAVTMTLTESGEYLGTVEGIAAKDLDKAAYVTFCYSDGTTEYCGGVLGYTIGSYCATQADKTGALADLAAATAVYGYYARQMFGAAA